MMKLTITLQVNPDDEMFDPEHPEGMSKSGYTELMNTIGFWGDDLTTSLSEI